MFRKISRPWRLLKKLQITLEESIASKKDIYLRWNIFFQDESRFGLFTRNARALTAKGVKPVCRYQHKFQNTYLFGAFSPITGSSFMVELPQCNSETFQLFLNEFALTDQQELKVVFLDNGAFHKAKRLHIPHNIVLIFLPAYSPELNPAEKVWWTLKREIALSVFESLDHLKNKLTELIDQSLTSEKIKSLTKFEIYLSAYQTILNV